MGNVKYLFVKITNFKPQGFWPGFSAGFFYFGFIFWWFWDLYPLDEFGLESKLIAGIILIIAFILYVATMALPWGISSLILVKFIKKIRSRNLVPFLIASIFTLAEYSRAILFSVVLYGDGGKIGPHWTMGNIAYWFIDFDFLATTASIWGIYGIDFVLVSFFSSVLLLFVKTINKKLFLINLIIIAILVSTANSITSNKNPSESVSVPIAIIQTNSPFVGFANNVALLEDLKNKLNLIQEGANILRPESGIILLPEGIGFSTSLGKILDVTSIGQYFNSLSDKELLIVDSIRSLQDGHYKSKATFISSQAGVIDFYDKEVLVPGGEFLPYLIKFPLILLNPSLGEKFKSYREYSAGEKTNIISYKNNQIKTLVCSDFISPTKSNRGQSDFILSLGSFSVWGGGRWVVQQAEPILRFRAIENDKYLAFASNGGKSYVINRHGKIEKMTDFKSYELLTGVIVPNKNRTWYNYVGDWPILLISLAFFGLGIIQLQITYFTNIRIYKLFIRRFVN